MMTAAQRTPATVGGGPDQGVKKGPAGAGPFSSFRCGLLLRAALAVGVALPGRAGVRPARVDTVGLLGAAARLVLRLRRAASTLAVVAAGEHAAGPGCHQRDRQHGRNPS